MRVVAGKYKGLTLLSPKSKKSRPTDNKVKEAIFDMLYPIEENFLALDLFSGTGQMGIEFLSRGAKEVYFNEKNTSSFKILKENLAKLKDENAVVSKKDFIKFLVDIGKEKVRFDYIFLDPPYDTDFIDKSLALISQCDLLAENGIIITESSEDNNFSEKYKLELIKEKIYGRKFVKFYLKWE